MAERQFKICPHCGAHAMLSATFCAICQHTYRTKFQIQPPKATGKLTVDQKLQWAAIGFIVYLFCMVMVIVVATAKPKPINEPQLTNSQEINNQDANRAEPPEIVGETGRTYSYRGGRSTGGRVFVRSYTRRDGTHVRSHTRRR